MNSNVQFFDGISTNPISVSVRRNGFQIDVLKNGNERIYTFSSQMIDQEKSSVLKDEIRLILKDNIGKMLWIQDHESEKIIHQFLKDFNVSLKKNRSGVVAVFLLLFSFIALLGIGFYFSVPLISEKVANQISFDYEKQIGDQILRQFISQNGALIKSSAADSLHANLLQRIDHQNLPITFYVIESETVNAMALPGGNIVVYTGMLKKLNSVESYYALLGHEIGHVVKRHVIQGLVQKSLVSISLGLLLGDASFWIGNIASDLTTLSYTRDAERESDDFAIDQLKRENISAEGMIALFKTLKEQGDQPSSLEFLSSHPVTESRLTQAETFFRSQTSPNLLDNSLRNYFDQSKREIK